MSFGVGINLWDAGVLGGDAGSALGVGTALQRILALSPSLLIWPANGAGWQGTSGGTLSASGQPVGLLPDLSQLGGKTQAEWLASAPELVTNGNFSNGTTGWLSNLASISEVSGRLVVTSSGASTCSGYQSISGLTPRRLYRLTATAQRLDANSASMRVAVYDTAPQSSLVATGPVSTGADATETVLFVAPADGQISIACLLLSPTGAGAQGAADNISLVELPGNHLRAGTWASPSDAARATYVIQTDPALYNVSGQPELVTNGDFATDTVWSKGTGWGIASGIATHAGTTAGNLTQTGILTIGAVYVITLTLSAGAGASVFCGSGNSVLNQAGQTTLVMQCAGSTDFYVRTATDGATVDNISVKEIPASQYKYALSFGGVDDYYSLLNAISITTDMTVVRAFKRASAGIKSAGLGVASTSSPYDALWFTDNVTYVSMGASGTVAQTANTTTGSLVLSTSRNASNQIVRRNGTQIGNPAAPVVSGSFEVFGRRNSDYNSGEISFLAVFPTELTGANLALVEQIAAATNGSVLA